MTKIKSNFKDGKKLKFSSKIREVWSKLKMGEKNPMWKGNEAGYDALHYWVKRYFPKPNKCSICQQEKKYLDIANISQEYKRDLSDWEWLCRKCHMIKDGRMEKFIARLKSPRLS